MNEDFNVFIARRIHELKIAVVNIFIFLPYFFSIEELIRTLFAPWKQIVTYKTKKGTAIDEAMTRLGDNLVSRGMGFMLRLSVILAYLVLQTLLVIMLPLIIVFVIIFLPLDYILHQSLLKPEQKKEQLHQHFLKTRSSDPANLPIVEKWFEIYWQARHQVNWWQKERLFAVPPIGRDWNAGYTPTLDQFSVPIPQTMAETRNFIDRVSELSQVESALSKSQDANVIIVGPEGIGRDIIVRAFGKRLYEGKTNATLAYKRILKLDIDKLVAEKTDVMARTELLSTIFNEAKLAQNIILYIPQIEDYINAESGRTDFSSPIAEYAALPTLQFIATTTPHDYQKFIYPNKALTDTFERVEVKEIDQAGAIEIMLHTALTLEERHQVTISLEAVTTSVTLAHRYMKDRPLPESAIDLLDEACVAGTKQQAKLITPEMVSALVEQKTHVAISPDQDFKNKLTALKESMSTRVIGQSGATEKIAATLSKSFILESDRPRPISSFLLLGPTGVGKTETAKTLAAILFDDESTLIRFDMSLYQNSADIARLVGNENSGEPGQLTAQIRERNFGVLLLDEFEKSNPDLLNIFLTILDEGYFMSAGGERVDCSHLIIVATSNAGADYLFQKSDSFNTNYQTISDELINNIVAQKIYSPELLNRFDGVIVYSPLGKEAIVKIAHRIIKSVASKLQQNQGITLQVGDSFLQSLIDKSYDDRFGARNMQRIIETEIEDKIAAQILSQKISRGQTITF